LAWAKTAELDSSAIIAARPKAAVRGRRILGIEFSRKQGELVKGSRGRGAAGSRPGLNWRPIMTETFRRANALRK
jgi:hypothetical protein